jgi:trk system potassium uptake protein TrkH
MRIDYKDNRLERVTIGVNALTAAMVVATFILLFGFDKPLLSARILHTVQVLLLCIFVLEKIIRMFNSQSKVQFAQANWYEVPLFILLGLTVFGSGHWFELTKAEAAQVRHFAVGIYLVLQVVIKLCRAAINLAASGRNPTQTLIGSFLFLIISGAGILMLPAASTGETNLSFVDALFTSTSATCVTGLVVKDTGRDFSLMGQVVIITLIQLGGLGIVVFGAVLALLLGQAFSLRESVAMQDLLNTRTLSRIGNMIAFIFIFTVLIEAAGAISLFWTWDDSPNWSGMHNQWFCSIFHSISAFCNAGFSLFKSSFIDYNQNWQIYSVVCPLIILGGLGFSVLYDLLNVASDRTKRLLKKCFIKRYRFSMEAPKRLQLQTRIVLTASASLIILGAIGILFFEHYTNHSDTGQKTNFLGALFQSITARTAGFNTLDIKAMSPSSKFILILLMFIGGSPGSTAGGIKTVTLAVVVMTTIAALRKRPEVEMFKRSVRIVVVGRAITITMLFLTVLFTATLALSVTESMSNFSFMDIMFEAGSALGTVGLTTGITPLLTTAGKLIIITVMLIGRLGPLTLLAMLTFNLKPARYSYPDESIIVG